MPPNSAMASSFLRLQFSTILKKASSAAGLRRSRVEGSARSGSFLRSRPKSGAECAAICTPIMEYIVFYYGLQCQDCCGTVPTDAPGLRLARSLCLLHRQLRSLEPDLAMSAVAERLVD